MSKIRFYNTRDYTIRPSTAGVYTGVPLEFIENEDETVFQANSTYDLTLLKNGVYKVTINLTFLAHGGGNFYIYDLYKRRMRVGAPTLNVPLVVECTQTINQRSQIPVTNLIYMYVYAANYTATADSYIQFEFLGENPENINSIPPRLISYGTILEFLPNLYPSGMGIKTSSSFTPAFPYTIPELITKRDLLSLESTEYPYVYFVKQSTDYIFDIDITLINSYLLNSSLTSIFKIYVNRSQIFSATESSITSQEIRSIVANFEISLNEGDTITFYLDDGASNSKIDPTLISVLDGWIGIKAKPQTPQPNVKLGGINKIKHGENDVAFEINKVTFEKTSNSAPLTVPYETKLYRQVLYRDIYSATIDEQKDETKLTLLLKNESIFKPFLNKSNNNFEITFFLVDTLERKREILCFIDKFDEIHNENGNFIELTAFQKQKILDAKIVGNKNHVLGTTENDLQVSTQSSTDFIYPEDWNIYSVSDTHLNLIENLINRNLINPFKIENGVQGPLDSSRIMAGLNGTNFTDLGDIEQIEIDFEIDQGETIANAFQDIFDEIGYEIHWEILRSNQGYMMNFFIPNQIVFNFDDTLKFMDSYRFSRDYSKAKLVTAIGSGFNYGYAESNSLNNRTMRPAEEYIDAKDKAKNSQKRADRIAKRSLPKSNQIYQAAIAFKSGASISHYDLKASTTLVMLRDNMEYYYTITGITTTIDSSGINFVYDMEQKGE